MVKKVEKWESDDGLLWHYQRDAFLYEAEILFKIAVDEDPGMISECPELFEWMKGNRKKLSLILSKLEAADLCDQQDTLQDISQ